MTPGQSIHKYLTVHGGIAVLPVTLYRSGLRQINQSINQTRFLGSRATSRL